MRKRIITYMCALSAAAVLVVALALQMLELRWLDEHGAEALLEPEYIFYMIIILVLALVAVLGLSLLLANRIVRPLANNEYSYEELLHYKRQIDAQSSQLLSSSSELEAKQRNLSLVLANMSEGIILIDRKGIIMMLNAAACALLGVQEGAYEGKHIFTVNNSLSLQAAVNVAMGGKSAHAVLEGSEAAIEVSVDPVVVEKVIRGAALFICDVTEKQAAEKMRREFSANVSHELKTPLTSISGYAELIKEGMVQPGDVAPFATKIYDEAQRLISLTDDIMRLSRLDEGGTSLPVEEICLMPVVQRVYQRLKDKAESHGIELSVTGVEGKISGNTALLDEMVYNLCDNAIKYNKPGGSVSMSVRESGGNVILTVMDTGVGIPREHQGRIFERFYRVDKSHSKATGGTGLGLSIVKNGAAFHKARIELDSRAGEGTTIRIIFNKAN